MAVQAPSQARKRAKKCAGGRKRHVWRLWLRRVALALLILAGAVFVSIVAFRFVNPPITAVMLVEKLKGETLKRKWVPFNEISPNLRLAVVSSEDGNFCSHWGVDWGAVRDAINEADSWTAVRGASTIPMQVARNLFLWEDRSYVRKALEVPLAYLMTALWPKKRMLEIYLNIAQWGPDLYGAEAASQRYFHKPASQLTKHEAVLLAAALPNPEVRNPAKPSRTMRLIANAVERREPYIAKRAGCVLNP
jgi:monofunctional biosynthetic peptidoglycan transglycosylase